MPATGAERARRRHRLAAAAGPRPVAVAPHAPRVGDVEVAALEGETVRTFETVDEDLAVFGNAVAIGVAQQRHPARPRLGEQHIAVGRHRQPACMAQPRGEQVGAEPFGHVEGRARGTVDALRPVARARRLIRRRQIADADLEAFADRGRPGRRRRAPPGEHDTHDGGKTVSHHLPHPAIPPRRRTRVQGGADWATRSRLGEAVFRVAAIALVSGLRIATERGTNKWS